MKVVLKYSPVARRSRYRGPRRMSRFRRPDRASITTWSIVDTELNSDTAEVINPTPRVHTMAHYLLVFGSEIDRARPIRMLEIGNFYGDSIRMWKDYFPADSLIVTIDLSSRLVKIADTEGIHVRILASECDDVLSELAVEFGPFDIILDGGSFASFHMVDSFRSLFETRLTDIGFYMVEDTYSDFWSLFNRLSVRDLPKMLIDAICGHYQVATNETNFRAGHIVVARRAAEESPRVDRP